jgi:hypothetical protein
MRGGGLSWRQTYDDNEDGNKRLLDEERITDIVRKKKGHN